MDNAIITNILEAMKFRHCIRNITRFCSEEDGEPYRVWKLETDNECYVLKKTSQEEQVVYETFLTDCNFAPKVYAFARYRGEQYMLMEYIHGDSMSRCSRQKLKLTLDALIFGQKQYWNNTTLADVGYSFSKSYSNRCKRLAYMGDLAESYSAYLETFSSVPRTLCNDDMLPFNVIVGEERAVILDWEYAGILPYPCAVARLLAFGEEDSAALFQMNALDRQFALDYYYENLVKTMGISREEYNRTMQLFFLKEYSEWVYCAGISGDYQSEYYKKYAPMAKKLAQKLGLYSGSVSGK